MKLVIGLGNPGSKYADTRHNIGFMVLDFLAYRYKLKFKYESKFNAAVVETTIDGSKAILVKPFTFMNLSGEAVIKVKNYYKVDIEDIIVVVDDINLDLGRIRMREFGSDGGHNGLKSINKHLNSDRYKRIRIGIGENTEKELNNYVLGKFSKKDFKIIDDSILDASNALIDFIKGKPYLDIMTEHNTPK